MGHNYGRLSNNRLNRNVEWFLDMHNFSLKLPNDTFLDLSKLKAFADDKINVTEKLKFILGQVTSIFSFSHNVFKSLLFQGR